MAQQAGQIRELQEAQLRQFIIPNLRPTGRELGRGAYGSVEELEVDGLLCAGKKFYNILIDPIYGEGAQRMVDMWYAECTLLSQLRHPNIVQFLGVHFVPDSLLPVLVMELLPTSLNELLESTADIPLSTKLSILQDVSRGLVYLHNRKPLVIHGNLSSLNVLLNSAMTAKIIDVGNSIVDTPPGQLAKTMSQGPPGNLIYMPPEAFEPKPKYGPSLDIFSFGHLALFTAIRIFPKDLLTRTYIDQETNEVMTRTELKRRAEYIHILHTTFEEQKHPLIMLIKECLEDVASKRPTAKQVLDRLEEMNLKYNPSGELNRVQL